MLPPAGDPPDIRFRHGKCGWMIFVRKMAKSGGKGSGADEEVAGK